MKITNVSLGVNDVSLSPEMEITIHIPLELAEFQSATDEGYEKLGKSLSDAYSEYVKENNLYINWKL